MPAMGERPAMRLVLIGGSGQLGTLLARAFHAEGHAITVVARSPRPASWSTAAWDGRRLDPTLIDGADVVVNLAGRSVDCRYTPANRALIRDSRVQATTAMAAAIAAAARPPRVWLQMSTATIYDHRFDAANDETTGRIGGDVPGAPSSWRFSVDVAQAWEAAAQAQPLPATRLVLMRTSMVMSPDRGGVFDVLLRLVRYGLGGRCGDGRQFVSWLHGDDFVRAVRWLIDRDLAGAVNLCAPAPLPHAAFMAGLRAAWGTRLGLPAARWMVELGTWALRTESELVLKSRRVVPGRLLTDGFAFTQPEWPAAARDLVARWRAAR